MLKFVAVAIVLSLLNLPAAAYAQIAPPAPGVDMPQAYFDRIGEDPTAFQFQRAWHGKFARAKAARARMDELRRGGMDLAALPPELQRQAVVAGTIRVPVIMIEYSNRPAPFATGTMDGKLFSNPAGTMTELYTEMSYGNVTLTGDVRGWVTATNTDLYFEGGCNGLCGNAKTGQLILEALTGVDAGVDFGQYDSDGPDGVPNSGDDDGFVDFVAIVHPENGGECGTTNLWSHRWVVTGWPQFAAPWQSNDPSANGGFVRVFDYTIQPALGATNGCSTSGPNEIGVFAHEFGHAFGLPDLYDTDGGGQGIGEHGLMGSGNWQLPPNPVHMSPWSKTQLGWLSPTAVGPSAQLVNIPDVETNAVAYQLNVSEEKFNRKSLDPIAGSWSLHCGIGNAAANARNWPFGKGYGNNWDESVRREFSYNGSNPVTLEYDVAFDTEATYDFAEVWIDVAGTRTKLKSYDGVGSMNNESVDLTPHLNGSGASSYEVSFRFVSDVGWSDEDGNHDSVAPMRVDNVSVTGGGESYSTDFEQREDGWHTDFSKNPNREYFLLENRNRSTGLYDHFANAEGLYIWHIEGNVGSNTSGSASTFNLRPAMVTLETADGLNELLMGVDRGDAGDAFPGSTGNTSFDNTTNPNSKSYNNFSTNVSVTGISAAGPTMSATMQAGRFPPAPSAITPVTAESGMTIAITALEGSSFAFGSAFLIRNGGPEFAASSVDWVGKDLLRGSLDLTGVPSGTYDVVVRGPDGAEGVLAGSFIVTNPSPVFIQGFVASSRAGGVQLTWDIFADEAITGFDILRRAAGGGIEVTVNEERLAPDVRSYHDLTVESGEPYEYVLVVVMPDGTELRSPRVGARAGLFATALYQNVPNPFNPSTRIQFSLADASPTALVVYDIGGRRVRTLVDENRPKGLGEVVWDGRNDSGEPVASGVYLYRLTSGKTVLTRKLLLLK